MGGDHSEGETLRDQDIQGPSFWLAVSLWHTKGGSEACTAVGVYGKPPDRDLLKRFEDAGADRVAIPLDTLPESEALDALNKIAESVF